MFNFNHLTHPGKSIFNYTLDRSHHNLNSTLFKEKRALASLFSVAQSITSPVRQCHLNQGIQNVVGGGGETKNNQQLLIENSVQKMTHLALQLTK